jgi:hypothetical protein
MKPAPPGPRRAAPAAYFRAEIEKAESQGVARDDMVLQLTLTDVSQLKRDQSVPLEDISFRDGTMQYLGVKVVQGNTSVSELRRTEQP